MIYVIQVMSSQEDKIIDIIKKSVNENIITDIFSPSKEKLIRLGKAWHKKIVKLFPGYIFVETDKPNELHSELYKISYFTKLLGTQDRKTKEVTFKAVSEEEEDMINRLAGKEVKHITYVSKIMLLKDKTIQVVDGPLYGMEGLVTKVDAHKKTVTIAIKLLNQIKEVVVAADIIKEI